MDEHVTPEQMRARADENAEWAQVAFGLPNREQDARELLLNAGMFRAAADEVDRLRAVIESAPHAGDIGVCNRDRNGYSPHLICTCWKADAL